LCAASRGKDKNKAAKGYSFFSSHEVSSSIEYLFYGTKDVLTSQDVHSKLLAGNRKHNSESSSIGYGKLTSIVPESFLSVPVCLTSIQHMFILQQRDIHMIAIQIPLELCFFMSALCLLRSLPFCSL
jgi:hypothetical protein